MDAIFLVVYRQQSVKSNEYVAALFTYLICFDPFGRISGSDILAA
jgi:hypothetical protein